MSRIGWLEQDMTWREIADVLDNLKYDKREQTAQLTVHKEVVRWLRRRLPDGGREKFV
jgi:hypothetical protein